MSFSEGEGGARRAVLEVVGQLDMVSAPDLHQQLIVLVHTGVHELVLDLSGVSFLDATGIGAIVAVANVARRSGQRVALAHPSPQVRRTLELAHVDDLLPIESE